MRYSDNIGFEKQPRDGLFFVGSPKKGLGHQLCNCGVKVFLPRTCPTITKYRRTQLVSHSFRMGPDCAVQVLPLPTEAPIIQKITGKNPVIF